MAAHHQLVRCSSTSFLTCDGMRQMVPLYTGQKYLGGNPWRFFFYLAKLNKSTGPHIFSFSRSRSSGNEIRERATHTHTRRHYVLESVEPMLLYTAIQTHMGEREMRYHPMGPLLIMPLGRTRIALCICCRSLVIICPRDDDMRERKQYPASSLSLYTCPAFSISDNFALRLDQSGQCPYYTTIGII